MNQDGLSLVGASGNLFCETLFKVRKIHTTFLWTLQIIILKFHFAHIAKINKLRVNFSNSDKVSLIIGAINDENITSAVEAAGIKEPNLLASYLKNKYYKPTRVLSDPTCNFNEAAPSYASYKVSHNTGKHKNIEQCTCCGSFGHVKQTCRHRNKVCRFCKYAGHVEKNCWKKKRFGTNI